MNDPQAWTIIGIFATAMLGGMTLMTMQFSRVIRAEISGVNGRIDGLSGRLDGAIEGVNGRIDGVEARIDGLRGEMNARFDTVDRRVNELDQEVANLVTKFRRSQ